MSNDLIITFIILLITTVLFISNKIRSDFVALLSMLALLLTGIITTEEALSGFSNSVVVMIAGLFVVGAGIFRTGLASMAAQLIVKLARGSEARLLFSLMIIVVVLVPVVISMA
ncbi:SLC13 family permease [Texcoconibacillus texcoconensis]|uniref:Di/tricarboxylate transporter n=1 Tax=Texcoconibacillus texcoconensis TaxID=1095777 RepID=A0A840QNX4_9BACI|nr:SLC13 family permease [Texcoconibacillus texcoconensis]MBB5173058.1 di/tricarboxylate transporter [Texcoconibacillus texcoconensis]